MELAALNVLDPTALIEAFGTLGVLAIVFAETGLLVGFFLPGDSLLFMAGFFASSAALATADFQLSLPVLLVGLPIAAILGAECGYLIGAKTGPRLFRRPDSRLFRQEYVERAEHYFRRFGPGKAVVLARFVPIVRTFLNPVAGVLRMPRAEFTLWNVVGGLLWVEGITLLGWGLGEALGQRAEQLHIDRYVLPAVVVIIALSLIPIVLELHKSRGSPDHPSPSSGSGLSGTEPSQWGQGAGSPPSSSER
ncbi:MAG TPA: VTT domain-containing protein [Mycobacteriales bacterium]|nr:VTT domain-containing protein [Mycobacteriales bacterium]